MDSPPLTTLEILCHKLPWRERMTLLGYAIDGLLGRPVTMIVHAQRVRYQTNNGFVVAGVRESVGVEVEAK